MTIAGGDPWKKHVAVSTAAGLPVVVGEAFQHKVLKSEAKQEAKKDTEPLPSLREFRARNPPTEKSDVGQPSTLNSSPPPDVTTSSTTSTAQPYS